MDSPQEKTCTKCLQVKPLDEFGIDRNTKDGHATRCKLCKRAKSADFREKHPEKGRQASANWRAANPEKRQAYEDANRDHKNARRRERYAADPEAELMVNRITYMERKDEWRPTRAAWESNNRPRRRAQANARRAANPAKARAKDKRWSDANPEKVKAKNAASYAKYPEAQVEKNQRRRAKKSEVTINDLSAGQIKEIKYAKGLRCDYCKKKFAEDDLTIDHLTPLGPEGPHTLHNVTAACRRCNAKKNRGPVLSPVQPLLLTIASAKPPKKKGA